MQHNAEGAPAFSEVGHPSTRDALVLIICQASSQSRTTALASNNALHDSITTVHLLSDCI